MSDEFDDSALPTSPGSRLAHADSRSIRLPRLITRICTPRATRRCARACCSACSIPGHARHGGDRRRRAFAGFLQRRDVHGIRSRSMTWAASPATRWPSLVRFVSQVSPEALRAVAAMLAETPGSRRSASRRWSF